MIMTTARVAITTFLNNSSLLVDIHLCNTPGWPIQCIYQESFLKCAGLLSFHHVTLPAVREINSSPRIRICDPQMPLSC